MKSARFLAPTIIRRFLAYSSANSGSILSNLSSTSLRRSALSSSIVSSIFLSVPSPRSTLLPFSSVSSEPVASLSPSSEASATSASVSLTRASAASETLPSSGSTIYSISIPSDSLLFSAVLPSSGVVSPSFEGSTASEASGSLFCPLALRL